MDLEGDLDKRQWPKPPFEIRPVDAGPPSEMERMLAEATTRYERSAYVSEGRMVLRHLGWKGVVKPIPPGESAITSLALDSKGRVIGATSGARSHLFIYDPEVDRVVDVCVVDEGSTVRSSVVACEDGTIIVGTRRNDGGKMLSFKTDYRETWSWKPSEPKLEPVELPKPDEGIACMTYDPKRERIYGLTSTTGTFFSMDVTSRSSRLYGPVDELAEFSSCLVVGCDGHVLGGKRWGRLFEFDPESEKLGDLGIEIPSLAGRWVYNRVDSMAVDQGSGVIYGGGTADGALFRFDAVSRKITSLGKPTSQPRTRAITVGRDERIYGISGRHGGVAHLFRYDPRTGDLRDLGIPLAHSDQYWHGHEFDSMVTGRSGEIYMGESDRISHLFIYFPPVGSNWP